MGFSASLLILNILFITNANSSDVPIDGSLKGLDYETMWREAVRRLQIMEEENQDLRRLIQSMERNCSPESSVPVCSSTSTCEESDLTDSDLLKDTEEDPRWIRLQKLAHEFFTLKIELQRLLMNLQRSNLSANMRLAAEQCLPGPSNMGVRSHEIGSAVDIHDINQLHAEMESLKKIFTEFYFKKYIKNLTHGNMFVPLESSETDSQGSTSTDEHDAESLATISKLSNGFQEMIKRARDLIQRSSRRCGSLSM